MKRETFDYYNEFDNFPATWLENLIRAGHLPPGIVDRRDIKDVHPSDLRGFSRCHFFAGIGGWPLALQYAGWRRANVWTISCPCQPWSRGRIDRNGRGEDDARDLWPIMMELIRARKPDSIFGEQVCAGIAKRWIERTRRNLKDIDYRFHAEVRRASDYGSCQIRPRFYFSADADGARSQRLVPSEDIGKRRSWRWRGEEDLQTIVRAPFEPGDRWPQPMLRKGHHGVPGRMGRLRAYGNAIDPIIAAQFISETRQGIGL